MEGRTLQIVIRGHHLPGRRPPGAEYDNVHVGLQVGRQPADLVPGDAASAEWHTDVNVIDKGGEADFRGPAVQGRRGERFLYLTWGEVGADGSFEMFRRAKLMLADVPGEVVRAGRAVADLDLTDNCGLPLCARVRPPAIRWSAADR